LILRAFIGPGQAGMRLDDAAKELFPSCQNPDSQEIIDWGGCTIDNAKVRVASRKLREGEEIIIGVIEEENCRDLVLTDKDVLHEDADCLAVAKGAGINCQRTPYQLKGTVEFAVEMYMKKARSREPARVIHRLDWGTSGVMIF
jgi:23S rRNA-/tRNA-specific pseudouridylate synthase